MPIESVIFDNKIWTIKTASEWLKTHNFESIKPVHITSNSLRYRIQPPGKFQYFRTVRLKGGIQLLDAK